MSAAANLFFLIIRIFLTIYCVDKAKQLNRNPIGWGFFCIFFPDNRHYLDSFYVAQTVVVNK